MFGRILSVVDERIIIENLSKKVESSLIGAHLVFDNYTNKIACEILNIKIDSIECIMIGEFIGDSFYSGVIHKPAYNSKARIINRAEVIALLGSQELESNTSLYLGKSFIYEGFNISANIDKLFSNHFAIIGNTGSGKSCSIARIFQNLFYRKNNVPFNANIVLFDVYGEYHPALNKINEKNGCQCKTLTSNTRIGSGELIKIPPYFLEVDDLALLLNADNPAQLSILEKALKLVYIFTEEEESVINHKNNIISKALLDILTSGRSSTQIRDQVIAVLSTFNTKDINLDSKIIQPGYTRTIKQCLNIDASGKINTMELVIEFLSNYINEELKLSKKMKPRFYSLKDLYNAIEFALISEGVLKSDKIYDMNNILKVRLDSIINSEYEQFFKIDNYISKEEFIKNIFSTKMSEKVQIVNFNLNYVDERFAKSLTKIFSKIFFDYAISLELRGGFPIQIILEEAHRYVQQDNDINVIGYNIFDRITKEGRKYGVVLGLITQRPNELSITALSQCSNYIVLKMFHPSDLDIIKSISHSIAQENVEKLKTLRPGTALCFGNAFTIPVFVKIDKPNPEPNSKNAQIGEKWFK